MMDASIGRGKTTNGIWIAKAHNIMDPCIMVMDVEGTDGRERGQDGTTFEKQSTLFALVVSDILFINMWCHDIGRENAANWPLLKNVFEVMMHIFSTRRGKATLHFVIRDTESPIETLHTILTADVEKIWETVPKTEDFKDTPLTDFFNVKVDALSNYKYEKDQFKKEVIQLRNQILDSMRVDDDRGGVIPTSGLPLHVKKLWETIKENKELDLPTHKEMVATVRCEDIAKQKLKLFASDEEWLKLKEEAKERLVHGFGKRLGLIWSKYLSEYDSESKYFQEGVRNAKRKHLELDALHLMCLAYTDTLDHLRAEVLINFKNRLEKMLIEGEGYAESVAKCRQFCEDEFEKGCKDDAIEQAVWDASYVRKQLLRDIENHALVVRTLKLPQVLEKCQARLATKIKAYLNKLFKLRDVEEGFTWPYIRSFLNHESDSAASALRSDIAAFDLDQPTVEQKVYDLKQYARTLVESKFKEETEKEEIVLRLMKERYILSLATKEGNKKDEPFPKCLKVLSTMAAIRLDESPRDDVDHVERLLFSALIEGNEAVSLD